MDERLPNELSLLEAIYPDQVTFNETTRELKYSSEEGSFQLRLPDGYLGDQLPDVIAANVDRKDVREGLRQNVKTFGTGEEVLDSIVLAFVELCQSSSSEELNGGGVSKQSSEKTSEGSEKATVIVWLHHLLNTNKRKQACHPPSPGVSGLTKPGYPGVLLYSGPSKAVFEHVNELKQLNWQAFQVRFESEDEWKFSHGDGVAEVESMREIVAEVGAENKEVFMEAMRMK